MKRHLLLLISTLLLAACGSESGLATTTSALLCYAPSSGSYALTNETNTSQSGCASPWPSPMYTIGSQVTGPVSLSAGNTNAALLANIKLIGATIYPSATWSCNPPNDYFDGCHASFSMTCTTGSQSDFVQITLLSTGKSQGHDYYQVTVSDGGTWSGVPCTRYSNLTFKE